jgi:hypothetical protein
MSNPTLCARALVRFVHGAKFRGSGSRPRRPRRQSQTNSSVHEGQTNPSGADQHELTSGGISRTNPSARRFPNELSLWRHARTNLRCPLAKRTRAVRHPAEAERGGPGGRSCLSGGMHERTRARGGMGNNSAPGGISRTNPGLACRGEGSSAGAIDLCKPGDDARVGMPHQMPRGGARGWKFVSSPGPARAPSGVGKVVPVTGGGQDRRGVAMTQRAITSGGGERDL